MSLKGVIYSEGMTCSNAVINNINVNVNFLIAQKLYYHSNSYLAFTSKNVFATSKETAEARSLANVDNI